MKPWTCLSGPKFACRTDKSCQSLCESIRQSNWRTRRICGNIWLPFSVCEEQYWRRGSRCDPGSYRYEQPFLDLTPHSSVQANPVNRIRVQERMPAERRSLGLCICPRPAVSALAVKTGQKNALKSFKKSS